MKRKEKKRKYEDKRKEKNFICKKISSVYEKSSLSMKCLIYKMSYG